MELTVEEPVRRLFISVVDHQIREQTYYGQANNT